MNTLLRAIEATALAKTVRDSLLLTGFLSALHLVGLTLIVGGVVVAALRLLNVILPESSPAEVMRATGRGMVAGLAISVVTGALLFAPRAPVAVHNGFFQAKMALLVAALAARLTLDYARRPRLTAITILVLWMGVVGAGCAYILIE